ncbi:MAG TPA: STAS domain-containing protein [Terriglobia bacterium]|nr:STAS domain-containing protein [Terriglobia bacterium]
MIRIDVDVALVNPKPNATLLRSSKSGKTAEAMAVLHVNGALAEGPCVCFFLEQIRLLIARGIRNFVIDLTKTDFIDARGVGSLAAAFNTVRDRRGRINYVLDSAELLSIIRRNNLDQVFEIFPDEESALASFHTSPTTFRKIPASS